MSIVEDTDSDKPVGIDGSESLTTVSFLYYFWLPAGKDEFGFAKQDEAPLADSVSYKKERVDNREDLSRTVQVARP